MNSKSNTPKISNKAQILVIVLIVILILAVVVLSLTNTLIKDSEQSIISSNYETLYSDAEIQTLNIAQNMDLDSNADLKTQLDIIFTNLGYQLSEFSCLESPSQDRVVFCNLDIDNGKKRTITRVEDSTSIQDVEVHQDEWLSFLIDPSANTDNISVSVKDIDGNITTNTNYAVEVSVDFKYNTQNPTVVRYSSIRGFLDPNNILGSTGVVDNKFVQPSGSNPFSFSIAAAMANIGSEYTNKYIDQNSLEVVSVRFRPIINIPGNTDISSVLMSVEAPGSTQTLIQSRIIETTAFAINSQNEIYGPQPIVKTSIPAHKPMSILDYVLRTNSSIN